MSRHCRYFLLLLWLCYLLISGVLLFTRGFLLSREVQNEKATCRPIVSCSESGHNVYNATNDTDDQMTNIPQNCVQNEDLWEVIGLKENESMPCLTRKANKVVLIVIDALKFDFAYFDESRQDSDLLPFQNKLPIIRNMIAKKPLHSKLFKFIADPPTTTMQRLKGLTTGSLPTFIDLGSNFATPEITEDNFLDQLTSQNKSIVFLGDDTWSGLFPNRFIREYAFPSFNVWDLDSVDTSIMSNLIPEIKKEDWSLFIAHFLGVDHCGHRFGPYHSEMSRKLTEMNEMISQVIDTIDEETILFVIGDHGMTATGDHGGDSEGELTAAMFVYSSLALVSHSDVNTVNQIDLVPTISTILGLPFPFSNLGSVILDALPLSNWQTLLQIVWHNVEQTTRYIKLYTERTNQFSVDNVNLLRLKYDQLRDQIQKVDSDPSFTDFVELAKLYLHDLKSMCAEVWVQFDPDSMSRGLLLVFLTIFLGFLIIAGIPGDTLNQILNESFLSVGYGGILVAAVCSIACSIFGVVKNAELTFYFSSGLTSIIVMSVVVLQNWGEVANHLYEQKSFEDWTSLVGRIVLILSLCGLFSNSYILEEATVLSFFLLTVTWLHVYNYKSVKQTLCGKAKGNENQTSAWLKSQLTPVRMKLVALTVFFSVLIRLSQYYWRCREEQIECESSIINKIATSATLVGGKYRNAECLFTLVCLALLATIVRIWLRCCGNLVGFSPTEVLARYGPTVLVVCTGGFWIAQSLPKVTKVKLFLPWQLQFLPWIIYSIVLAALVSLFVRPLCVYVVPKINNAAGIQGDAKKIPLLFNQMKELMQDRGKGLEKDQPCPVVFGLATVYSAVFVILCLFVFLLISLLLGDTLSPSVVLLFVTGAVLLTILSIVRYEKAVFVAQLFSVSWTSVICWGFLSSYYFYGTGHQPTFPGINWDAAFVGTGGQFSNHIVPAILVGINTFGSHLLVTLALPLLLVTPFTLHVMFPSLLSRGGDAGDKAIGMKRGEMVLYEREDLMYRGLFTLCAKYILIHALRIFACMLAATIHCRHLMVWKIFAPKLIFEGLSFFVILPAVLFVYLLCMRITVQVEHMLCNLEKQQR